LARTEDVVVRLDRVSANEVDVEAARLGFVVEPQREVPETERYLGSTIVMLRARRGPSAASVEEERFIGAGHATGALRDQAGVIGVANARRASASRQKQESRGLLTSLSLSRDGRSVDMEAPWKRQTAAKGSRYVRSIARGAV
jgi:hypothetical protein